MKPFIQALGALLLAALLFLAGLWTYNYLGNISLKIANLEKANATNQQNIQAIVDFLNAQIQAAQPQEPKK